MVENLHTDNGFDDILEKKRISEFLNITREEAQRLASEYPEMAKDFADGMSYSILVEKYNVEFERYPNSTKTLVLETIKVLIPNEQERTKIAHEHQVARGEGLRDRKEGIFSRTGQESSDFERAKAMRIDPKVRYARAVKMGRGSTKAKGLYCWDELKDPETDLDEQDTVIWLAVAIKRKTGRAMGNPDYPKIHEELERRFKPLRGYERKVGSMRMKILRMAKQLGIKL